MLQLLYTEFTSWNTLQHNSLAELAFPKLAGQAQAMLGGNLEPDDNCAKGGLESVACATQLDGLVVIEVNYKLATCNMQMYCVNPKTLASGEQQES